MFRKILVCFTMMLVIAGCSRIGITERENADDEKNLIHDISVNEGKDRAELRLGESVYLKINNHQAEVFYRTKDDNINELKKRFGLSEIGDGIISVVYRDYTASGEFIIFELFLYKENKIDKIFSSRDLYAKIQGFDEGKGLIEFSIPEYNAACKIKLSEKELERWQEKRSEADGGSLIIDSNFLRGIENNLLLNPVDYCISDSEQGNRKLYILSEVYTVGAITPSVRDRAVIEFDLTAGNISYLGLVLERDSENDNTLFSFFR